MLRLLIETGFIEDNSLASIRCMGHAMAAKNLFLSDIDFYEEHFEAVASEVASFLLSRHILTETEQNVEVLKRLLDRNARPEAGALFAFSEEMEQSAVVNAIKSEISGFVENQDYWTQGFPNAWW